MNLSDFKSLDDARKLELLEQPELWPEDPAVQAELSELLELHLALAAHRDALVDYVPQRRWTTNWALAAATVLMALIPSAYALNSIQHTRALAQDRARLDQLAMVRTQDRAWAAFFQQTSTLIREFQAHPELCKKGDTEDRSQEREAAVVLLAASHQLAAQGSLIPEAEAIRGDLHSWLSELAFEDACLKPERAEELRQWASTHDLGDQADRMGQLLKGETP